jgi:hypothetical protein
MPEFSASQMIKQASGFDPNSLITLNGILQFQMLMEGLEVIIGVQQGTPVFNTPGGNDGINCFAYGNALFS